MAGKTKRIALCGLLAALATVVLFLGGLLPFATFTAPALAGIFLLPLALEFGIGSGLMAWFIVGLLGLLIVPDKELGLIFIFLLGYYPMLKSKLDSIHKKALQWLVKMLLFNTAVFAMYSLILFVFPIGEIVTEFAGASRFFTIALIAAGNLAFVLYDLALAKIILLYYVRLRPILFGKGR